jgi:hypothetical protein
LPTVAVPEPSSPPPQEADNFEEEDDYDPAEDDILSKQSEKFRISSLVCPSAVLITQFHCLDARGLKPILNII